MSIFHLAVPTNSIESSIDFYHKKLSCEMGRKYEEYVVFNFYGHQLVCHLDEKHQIEKPTMYPRHYGLIFETLEKFDQAYQDCVKSELQFFRERFERFKGKAGWHESFFVTDPSNNLLEFKYYHDKRDIY